MSQIHANRIFRWVDGHWTYQLKPFNGSRCRVRYCSGHRGTTWIKGRKAVRNICEKCRSRLSRINRPVYHILNEIARRARDKGVPFNLTPEDILALPGYLENRGCGRKSLQIDRIKPSLGYVPGNIQPLTTSQNASKGDKEPNIDNDNDPW